MNICEKCGNDHDGSYGSGRFCSSSCARSRGKRSNEVKEKIRKSQIKLLPIECPDCGKEFKPRRHHTKFCSRSCSSKHSWMNDKYKERMSDIASKRATKRHNDGDTTFGWKSRDKIEPSYPESIAIRFFDEHSIVYEREVRVGRYFADFIIDGIVIEIDGKQHELHERQISDRKKDKLLIEHGYKVIRIKYPSDNIRDNLYKIFIGH